MEVGVDVDEEFFVGDANLRALKAEADEEGNGGGEEEEKAGWKRRVQENGRLFLSAMFS